MSYAGERRSADRPARMADAGRGASPDASREEVQRFVNATLGVMTGGCELCIHSDRLYCTKLKKQVRAGTPRCESFARRPWTVLP